VGAVHTAQWAGVVIASRARSIVVASDGSITDEELTAEIESAFPDQDLEALTGEEITDENQSDVERGLSFFTIFLTIFAAISLFVGSFIIFNVFSISAAQREKENALMRAIGASRRQVTRVLFVEALVVGAMGGIPASGAVCCWPPIISPHRHWLVPATRPSS
jgi:putative ABC transport system permease protein